VKTLDNAMCYIVGWRLKRTHIGPIWAFTQCKLKIPLTYPDHVTVGAKTRTLEKDRFTMEYTVISHKHRKLATLGDGVEYVTK